MRDRVPIAGHALGEFVPRRGARRWGHVDRRPRPVRADERGAAAVEFALVTPILLALMIGIAQFGSLFFLHSSMLSVARDASRRLATGSLTTSGATAWVTAQLPGWGSSLTATVVPPGAGGADSFTVTISLPLAEAVPVDPFGLFRTGSLTASVSMRSELPAS